MAELAISAKGVSFRYGKFVALDNLNLDVERGSTTGLLGPNGAGKSTLIRLLVGLAKPRTGDLSVLGGAPADAKARIGYMPQAAGLYEELSPTQNVDFFARIYGLENRKRAVADVLEQVDLSEQANRQSYKLSGGMKQRVSLACALVNSPDLLLLDEPTVGLDPVLRANLWDLFDDLTANGATLLISSHSMDDAIRCGELIFMRDGAAIAHGSQAELLAGAGVPDGTLEDAFLHYAGVGRHTDSAGARGAVVGNGPAR
ncbi:MAG: ABC transporter ATP-binding protein [Gammaproteobacteria bacterium]|nr:ABC transporter ATP-binding protein [Gammaproteobacteria bacterium]